MSRAQEIVDEILSGERYARSHVFSDRVYRDDPILRAGIRPRTPSQGSSMASAIPRTERLHMPAAYRKMAHSVNPYGDGLAAQRSVHAIEHYFGLGDRPLEFDGMAPNAVQPAVIQARIAARTKVPAAIAAKVRARANALVS